MMAAFEVARGPLPPARCMAGRAEFAHLDIAHRNELHLGGSAPFDRDAAARSARWRQRRFAR
jgi:hypothetical protein